MTHGADAIDSRSLSEVADIAIFRVRMIGRPLWLELAASRFSFDI
jgi:hypothetical protein